MGLLGDSDSLTALKLNSIEARSLRRLEQQASELVQEPDSLTDLLKSEIENVQNALDRVHTLEEKNPGFIGKLRFFAKRLIRKMIYRHIKYQADANDALLRLARVMLGYIEKQNSDMKARVVPTFSAIVSRQVTEQLERELTEKMSVYSYPSRYENPDFDYFGFEQKYRGSFDVIKERLRVYLPHFEESGLVLDLGCGRGEFTELLVESGKRAQGVDSNEKSLAFARARKLPVERKDLFEVLEDQADGTLAGVFLGQVVEHLTASDLCRLVKLSARKLKPRGTFVAETPNPRSLCVFAESFYMDLTHIKPVHPFTFEYLMRANNFGQVDFIYSGSAEDLGLPNIEGQSQFNEKLSHLNQIVFGHRDYAIVARK